MNIIRERYFEKLIGYKDKQIIKVITGVRRCGKSTLLKMFEEYLLKQGAAVEQIISINFEDFAYQSLWDAQNLYDYIKERVLPKKMYLILDEIQNVKDFQRVVDSYFIQDNVDIYITGSNAHLLSGELATLLSGRYVKIEMLPLSFAEFVQARQMECNLERAYQKYIELSSFPYITRLEETSEQVSEYLRGIYDTIILKDVMWRRQITDPMMVESVLRFVMDNVGNQLSTKKISDTMTSEGRKINVRTVESYLKAFMESYIIYQAKRYDVKGRQYLKTLDKYYIVDVGLRNAMLGSTGSTDVGHILENVIYLELIRRGYDVYIGKVDNLEVDFVAKRGVDILYVQVAATVREASTLERELRVLKKIKDNNPKYILTLDIDPVANYDGIKKINALDYLIGNSEL
jgi:Predicted ATPase (AAA+ superfamily)